MSQPQQQVGEQGAKLENQLHARKLELADQVQQNVEENVEKMLQASAGETTALDQLAEKLQQTKDDVAVRVQAVLEAQHRTAAIEQTEDAASETAAAADSEVVAAQLSQNHYQRQQDLAVIQQLEVAQSELAQVKADLALLESTTVPTAEHTLMELHLTGLVKHNQQLQLRVDDLREVINQQQQEKEKQSAAVTTATRPLPAATGGSKATTTVVAAHGAQVEEIHLLSRKVLQDDDARSAIEERDVLAKENIQMKARLLELEFKTKLINQDAQDIMLENGVLKTQLANLFYKHREVVPLDLQGILSQPMREGDLGAFGNYTLPDLRALTGVSLVAPVLDNGAVDFGAFSVDNISQLVERCGELSKELFKATQGRYVGKVDSERIVGLKHGRESPEEGSDEEPLMMGGVIAGMGVRPLPAPSARRPIAPLTREIAVQCDALMMVLQEGHDNMVGLGVEDIDVAEHRGAAHQQMYDYDDVPAHFAAGQDSFSASVNLSTGSVLRGRSSNYISSDCVGTEALVAAVVKASERQGNFEAQTSERRAEEEANSHLGLLEAMEFIQELEGELVSCRSNLLAHQSMVSDLQTNLAIEQSRNVDLEHLSTILSTRVSKPLEGLQASQDSLMKILESASDERRVVTAAMEESRSEMLQISQTFASQEEAICVALSQQMAPVAGVDDEETQAGDGSVAMVPPHRWSLTSQQTSSSSLAPHPQPRQLMMNLKEEVQTLRTKLVQEQQRSGDYYTKLTQALEKVNSMAEQQWSMEAYKEDYEERLEVQAVALKTMLSSEEASRLQAMIQQLTVEAQQAQQKVRDTEEATTQQKEELNQAWAKEKNEVHTLNTQLGAANFQYQQLKQRCLDAENDAGEAQKGEQEAQDQVQAANVTIDTLNKELLTKSQCIENLQQQVETLRGSLLSLDVSRELLLQLFPDNQAVAASTERLGVLEQEKRSLVQRCLDAEQHLQNAQAEKHHETEEIRHLRLEVDRLETCQMGVQEQARAAIEVAEQRADSCAHEAAIANTRCSQATTELDDLQTAYVDMQQRLEVFKSDPATLNVRKYGVQYTLNLEAQMEELHMLKVMVEEKCQQLETDLAAARVKCDELEAQTDVLQGEVAAQEKAIQNLHATAETAQSALATANARLEQTDAALQTSQTISEERQAEVQRLQQQVTTHEQVIEKGMAQQATLEADIQQHQSAKDALDGRLKDACGLLSETQQTLTETKKENAVLKNENDRLADDGIQLQSECDRLMTEVREIKALGGPSNLPGAGGRLSHHRGSSSVRRSRGGPSLMSEIRQN